MAEVYDMKLQYMRPHAWHTAPWVVVIELRIPGPKVRGIGGTQVLAGMTRGLSGEMRRPGCGAGCYETRKS